ncbi:hypothetical protein Q8A73_014691 [Channa argus]|nr:hypothetical protein Q8A73_014691 [Channa argus]
MRPSLAVKTKLRARLRHRVKSVLKSEIRAREGRYELLGLGFLGAPGCSLCASSTRRADSRSYSRTGGKQGEENRRTGPLLCSSWLWGKASKTWSGSQAGNGLDPDTNYGKRSSG